MNTVERELAIRGGRDRIFELDALRGVAAIIVILHHFRFMFHMQPPRIWLRPFFAGHAAVVLFFTLSGFVLSITFWKGRSPSYPLFLVRRFFRIYLPYAAACLIAVAVAKPLLFAQLPLTPWFYITWHSSLTPGVILHQLFFISTNHKINTAFWSIRYEIELSLVFPLVCALLLRLGNIPSIMLGCCCAVGGIELFVHAPSALAVEIGTTMEWASCFIFGGVLAKSRTEVLNWCMQRGIFFRTGLILLGLAGFFSTRDVVMIVSSCALIVAVQYGLPKRILQTPVPEYLGRISYSLYLLHGTVLFAIFILLYGKVTVTWLFVLYVLVAFGLSHIFNRYVEEPFDRTGKNLTRTRMVALSKVTDALPNPPN